jgi:tetratricopeptide (TPR) repeat protein
MRKRLVLAVAGCWLAATPSWGFDTVKTADQTYPGTIRSMGPLEVVIGRGVQTPQTIPVNEIESIRYDDEPTLLNTSRVAINAGRYEDALETLGRIDMSGVSRQEVKADIQFYQAYCASRIALTSGSDQDIMSAGSQMSQFVRSNANNYHYLEGCAMVGDLLVAAGRYQPAEAYYGELEKAPWPDFKMRAGVAKGQAQLAAGKTDEALKSFEAVLAINAQGAMANRHRLAATLGRARCLAQSNPQEAVQLIEEVINQADPERHELLAQAYNALGTAYRQAGRAKDAILAFLHVDVLYFRSSREHIEALTNLVELWNEVQKPERSAEAAQILRERYNR